jgi:Fe2+ transport system protein FeoA
MEIQLSNAPFDSLLTLSAATNPELGAMLSRLGLFRGQKFVRQNEEILIHPVRVRAPVGEVVLGGRMATRIIVHLADGRRLPISDMSVGQTGHIEGTTCSARLLETLAVLGLSVDEPVTYVRQLPHMEYAALVGTERRERLTEGMAAKIWGRIGERSMQFVSAGKGQPFFVEKILGGQRASEVLEKKGIVPGSTISLQAVAPVQVLTMTVYEPVVITTEDGLHLHLRPDQAERIWVHPVEAE